MRAIFFMFVEARYRNAFVWHLSAHDLLSIGVAKKSRRAVANNLAGKIKQYYFPGQDSTHSTFT